MTTAPKKTPKSLKAADLAVDPIVTPEPLFQADLGPPTEPEPTIGEVLRLPEEPDLPGFEMSDDPFPDAENVPETSTAEDLGNPKLPGSITVEPYQPPVIHPVADRSARAETDIVYESRIQVLEAFRYMGSFHDRATGKPAPDWIDRNWLSHGDWDPLRQIEPGPALRVPLDSGVVYARIGDYICQQSVTIDPNLPAEIRLEVWPAETFQKLFIPKPSAKQVTTVEASVSVPTTGFRSSRPHLPVVSPPASA